jgi:hypothetical protein
VSSGNSNPSLPSRKLALDRRAIDTFGYLMVAGVWLERQIEAKSKGLGGRISALPKPAAGTSGLGLLTPNQSHPAQP